MSTPAEAEAHRTQAQALRLVLHWTGCEDLLHPDDHGDDLFDAGLLAIDPENDALSVLTVAGGDVIRDALAAHGYTR